MRLFLVPISTRRAFVYCRSPNVLNASFLDRVTAKAAETWEKWERADKGWRKTLVSYGHVVLQRIPYEEWGLKSIPPLSAQRQIEETRERQPVDVVFPGNVIKSDNVLGILEKLGTERQDLHRRKMWWSIGLAPLTAPIAVIPLVPNIPFFYLAYRGWSHWRALSGSRHLVYLLEKGLLQPQSSPELENFYSKRLVHARQERKNDKSAVSTQEDKDTEERLLLEESDGMELGQILGAPEIAIEVERAVVQIRQKLHSEQDSSAQGTRGSNASKEKA
ncbi:hypothetical protein VTN77DRAFT_9597 [Rasamsonia byssochlamydoides]|uniref:uncharacterized protein n=1 Tax=Rasamsonia byssochlamydoides TaxID=89139 RepID=UPI00374274CF